MPVISAGPGSVVTVLWSPAEAGGYALVVDGIGEVDGDTLVVRPTRAVLHRPAAGARDEDTGDACTADCVEVALPSPGSGLHGIR